MRTRMITLCFVLSSVLMICCCISRSLADVATSTDLPDGKKTLTMWCIATESDASRPAYEAAIAALKEAHPEIEFEWEAFENNSYKEKIKTAMSDPSTLPDIFFTWAGGFSNEFVKSGDMYCMEEIYAEYADQLPAVMMQNVSYGAEKKPYAVPLTMNTVTLFVNMDLLEQAGWYEVPNTYEDLIDCCEDLIAAGICPFGCAGTETWCVTEYLEPMIQKTIGSEALRDLFNGRTSWNDPTIADTVDAFQEMVTNGYFDPNGTTLNNDQIRQCFINGQYNKAKAFMLCIAL